MVYLFNFLVIILIIPFLIKKYMEKHGGFASEKLLVSDKGTVVYPINFKPEYVHAEFTHHAPHVHPSCNPVIPDSLKAMVIELDIDYGIELTWNVNEGFREVKWEAKEFVF